MTKRRRVAPKPILTAELRHADRYVQRWLIFNQHRHIVCFVEKWKPELGYIHPFKIFRAVCGQGPVHMGDMVATSYGADTATEAAYDHLLDL